MIKMKPKKTTVLKYFELPIPDARDWDWRNYVVFVIESLYTTVFPFIAGMLLVYRRELIWIAMLFLPIYFRLNIQKKEETKKKKRIYVK